MSVALISSFAIIEMPNPSLQNQEAGEQFVNHDLAMDGTNYTYVKSSLDRRLTMTFKNIGRGKMVELQEFFRVSAGKRITFRDWRNKLWQVVFDDDILNFTTQSRSAKSGGGRQEQGTFELVLVEVSA